MKPLILLLLIFPLGTDCGSERWDIKTASDKQACSIDTIPTLSTMKELSNIPIPYSHWLPSMPRLKQEQKIVTITGEIAFYKSEADADYHLVITDSITMIAEIPAPECLANSRFKQKILAARKTFEALKTGAHTVKHGRYKITGVIFFDKLHGQTGVAKNGIELHPVLEIKKE